MKKDFSQSLRSFARVAAGAAIVVASGYSAKLLGFDYEDAKTILALFNAYFPEAVALAIGGAVGVVFYRANAQDNDFQFVNFFINKPGRHKDIFKLGYFVLLVTSVWLLFTLVWRDKLTEGMLGIILGAFIVKNVTDSIGKSFGKTREEPQQEGK